MTRHIQGNVCTNNLVEIFNVINVEFDVTGRLVLVVTTHVQSNLCTSTSVEIVYLLIICVTSMSGQPLRWPTHVMTMIGNCGECDGLYIYFFVSRF